MNEPIFKAVFGATWDALPRIMHRHYANYPYSEDSVTVDGIMKIESSWLGRLLKPFFFLTGTLVPYEGDQIPVTVDFLSNPKTQAFCFNRVFRFPGKTPYRFRSTLYPVYGSEMIEVMRCGIGWRCAFDWTGAKVTLSHRGYALRLLGILIPLPIGFLMGEGRAEEVPIDDESFSMTMEIVHPLWGKVFSYSGIFRVVKDR